VSVSSPVAFFHCSLVRDPATGKRLAKRDGALSLRALRESGCTPEQIRLELFGDDGIHA
jgi:glutamyl-tRNA synthetase